MAEDMVTDSELIRAIAVDIAFIRGVIEPLLPLAEMIGGGNGQVDAVRIAGLRKALRKKVRDAS